jgi:hypothetical protein
MPRITGERGKSQNGQDRSTLEKAGQRQQRRRCTGSHNEKAKSCGRLCLGNSDGTRTGFLHDLGPSSFRYLSRNDRVARQLP